MGLPVHLDGRESQKSSEARTFGQWLAEATGVGVEFFDERFTSVEAEQHLLAAKLTKKRRKERLDKLAAQIMLSAYLESAAGQGSPDLGSPAASEPGGGKPASGVSSGGVSGSGELPGLDDRRRASRRG